MRNDFPMLSPADLRDISRLYMGTSSALGGMSPPSPLHAADFRRSPAVIAVAGHDPHREEGMAYAARLAAASVPVQLLRFDDMFHPFFGFFEAPASAWRANDETCRAFGDWLRQHTVSVSS